ncbi:hypothetical protein [Salisediminibacterium beveridgei]|uniref:Lipoprotein n=1 Tax=Salisediminibacterium beveridgei TaxID=632773 RepID=A0A1D7QYS4_9BACI|nr:hypothetical protein [Salisediminibacterium beveridgei]AOM84165.1 hypothetical protein BBEV_2840 [Salisediminibacterium beveridgei]
MKMLMLFMLIFTAGCQPPTNEEGIHLEIEAQYTSGTLYITPVIVHDGSDEVTVELTDSDIRIVDVTRGEQTVYESSAQSSQGEPFALVEGEQYEGSLVRFTADEGEYEVRAEAELTLNDGELMEELSLQREVTLQVEQ